MGYLQEASTWRERRRRRQRTTLLVVVGLLVLCGLVAAGIYAGVLGHVDRPGTAAPVPVCPSGAPHVLRPHDVTLRVYNGTSRQGLAGDTAEALRSRGFQVATVANDPKHTTPKGTAVVRYGKKGLADAQLVAKQVAAATLQRDGRRSASVDLVLGARFSKLAAAPKVAPAPTPTPTCTPSAAPSATTSPSTTAKPTK